MQSFAEIIRAWPDDATFADDGGVTTARVAVWKSRDRIPAEHWGWIIQAAERRGIPGVSWEALAVLLNKRRQSRSEAAQ